MPLNLAEYDDLYKDFRMSSRIKQEGVKFIEDFTYHFNLKRIRRVKGGFVDRSIYEQEQSELIKGELNEIIKRICSLSNLDIKMIMKDAVFLKIFCEEVSNAISTHLKMYHLKNEITEEDLKVSGYGYSNHDFKNAKFQNLPVKIVSKSGKIHLYLFYFKLLISY